MKSRPELFILSIVSVAVVTSLLGFFVFKQSQADEPAVREADRRYSAQKQQAQSSLAKKPVADYKQEAQTEQQTTENTASTDTPGDITVYFSKNPDSENDPNAVYPVTRSAGDQSAVNVAINELIAGPNPSEKASGYYGGLLLDGQSSCGGQDFTLRIEGETAKLQFCRHHISYGSVQDTRELAQITNTLKQLGNITKVLVLNQDGNCLFDSTKLNTCM